MVVHPQRACGGSLAKYGGCGLAAYGHYSASQGAFRPRFGICWLADPSTRLDMMDFGGRVWRGGMSSEDEDGGEFWDFEFCFA